jgi:hypothetical protein
MDAAIASDDRRRIHDIAPWAVVAAIAGTLTSLVLVAGWRGSDVAAHTFRVGLVRREGFGAWNNYWFGGHHTPGYGILTPTLGAVVGIGALALLSAVVSAVLADVLITGALGRRNWWASLWFAAGTVTNVMVGRLPFALGLTIGLGALVAAQHRKFLLAGVLAVLAAAASAVVSVFLGLIFVAWAFTGAREDRTRAVALSAAAVLPVLVLAAFYPQGGTFPFRFGALVWTLVVSAVVVVLVPGHHRLVRAVAVLYAGASVAAFLVPSPLGANITRFAMYAAGPVLLALVPARRVLAAAILPLVWWWQWSPALDAVTASSDPSTSEDFYAPLIDFLEREDVDGTERIEVVPTQHHWESAYVALEVPIARGWERQLDRRFNSLFYEDELTAGDYERWLRDTGVRYVALPDAPLDAAGEQEAELLRSGLDFLRGVWWTGDWRVWEVVDSPGLVDGPAELVELGTDTLTIDVEARGDVVVRVRSSSFWDTDPSVCLTETEDGWIELVDVTPGVIEVYRDEASPVTDTTAACDEG